MAAGSSNCTAPFFSSQSFLSASDTLIWYSSGFETVTSDALIHPVASLGRVGRYTCSQSWYWSNTRKLRGKVYSVCGLSVVVGCAFGSGDAYTATSPPLVTALRIGADAYVAEMPDEFSTAVVDGGFGVACWSESSRVATNTPAAATIRRTTSNAPKTTRRRCWRRLRCSVRGENSSAMRARVYRSGEARYPAGVGAGSSSNCSSDSTSSRSRRR